MKKLHIGLLLLITLFAAWLRFYKLDTVPAGLHGDGASQGYNAFSLIQTGKDRYGESFPVLFRSNGSYQPPLYTYLTIIPVLIFGNTPFSARFLSAFSGLSLVLITYLFLLVIFKDKTGKYSLALIGAATLALSPWAIFFSRLTIEANLGLILFAISMLLFTLSLKSKYLFPVACFVLGLSTHAYYSERLISIIFLPVFIFIFRKYFHKKWLILGLAVFAITQIPHMMILQSGALARRFNQVGLQGNGGLLGVFGEFIKNFLNYYSPKDLFFDSDINLGRLMPDLSVFYNWMLIPFLIGIVALLKGKLLNKLNLLSLLLVITPIPAALTGDVFYPLRTLDLLWVLTMIISLGIYQLYKLIISRSLIILLLGLFIFYSLFSLYISYFVLFKYEKSKDYGYPYVKLMDKLKSYPNKHIVIDAARDPGIGIRIAYLKSYDPVKIQQQLRPRLNGQYYSNIDAEEVYLIDNIEVKPLSWGEVHKKDYIFIGDQLAISEKEVSEHKLKLEFEIPDITGEAFLTGYSTYIDDRPLDKGL